MRVYFEYITYGKGLPVFELDPTKDQAIANQVFFKSANMLTPIAPVKMSLLSFKDGIVVQEDCFIINNYSQFLDKFSELEPVEFHFIPQLVNSKSNVKLRLAFFSGLDENKEEKNLSIRSSLQSSSKAKPKPNLNSPSLSNSRLINSFLIEEIITPDNSILYGKTMVLLKMNKKTKKEISAFEKLPVTTDGQLLFNFKLVQSSKIDKLKRKRMRLIVKIVNKIFHPIISKHPVRIEDHESLSEQIQNAIAQCCSDYGLDRPLDHECSHDNLEQNLRSSKEHLKILETSKKQERDRSLFICKDFSWRNLPPFFKKWIKEEDLKENYMKLYNKLFANIISTGKQLRRNIKEFKEFKHALRNPEYQNENFSSLLVVIGSFTTDKLANVGKSDSGLFKSFVHPAKIRLSLQQKLVEAFTTVNSPFCDKGRSELLISRHLNFNTIYIKNCHIQLFVDLICKELKLTPSLAPKNYYKQLLKQSECKVKQLAVAINMWLSLLSEPENLESDYYNYEK